MPGDRNALSRSVVKDRTPNLEAPDVVDAGIPFETELTLGRDLLAARRVWLSFIPRDERRPRRLCEIDVSRGRKIKSDARTFVSTRGDAFVIETMVRAPGQLRVVVLHDDLTLWDATHALSLRSGATSM